MESTACVTIAGCLRNASAILNCAVGTRTEEANAVQAVFNATAHRLEQSLLSSTSGCELTKAGYLRDVQFAADLNASEHVPLLSDDAYRSPS